jgi:hypothetical protein
MSKPKDSDLKAIEVDEVGIILELFINLIKSQ